MSRKAASRALAVLFAAVSTVALTAARSDRANLVLNLEKARRELQTAENAINALTLRAPRDGIVVLKDHPWEGRKLKEGDGVFVGLTLALIPDPASMQVTASLADVDDRKVATHDAPARGYQSGGRCFIDA